MQIYHTGHTAHVSHIELPSTPETGTSLVCYLMCTCTRGAHPLTVHLHDLQERSKTSRSSEAYSQICLPTIVYFSNMVLMSDVELWQSRSENCMEFLIFH